MTRVGRAIALLLASLAGADVTAADANWRSEPPMHHSRAAHAVVRDAESIYALAGTGERGAPVLVLERFDGTTWRNMGAVSGPGLNAPAAVSLNGKIYLIGGFRTDTNVPSADARLRRCRAPKEVPLQSRSTESSMRSADAVVLRISATSTSTIQR